MKQLLTALIGILIAGNLHGQHTADEIPDNVRRYIVTRVSADILRYRVDYNPAIKEADKIHKKIGQEILYKDPAWILFENPAIYDSPELIMRVSRWPADNPRPNYYLVTKGENRFAVKYDVQSVNSKSRDTLYSSKYDNYNSYFPNDDRFLVYYDEKKKIYKNMSGNFYQHPINGSWFKFDSDMIPQMRLAQYPVGEIYNFIKNGDTTIYMVNRGRLITHGGPGNILVKVSSKFPYDYIEIIFYSNKALETGDNNNTHFYEIKQIRDYSRGYPYTPQDLKSTVRLLSQEEIAALEVYYHQPIYKFGSIDESGIPVKK
ncbi:hypothetical protein [Chitinophaga sp. CF418]|uniref:hypothetical protein n=1 Tax=Chitinophaga sp. CF418 TaxID=1855287 RepID=UPI00091119C8|nr:hypothetical protein [Chitinophaga sp. CF418]SHM52857.1 hypothetical protein SAMN05216311_102412 [Chitinophaga sp. CF418]